jgi:hypothetical protein
MMTYKTQFIFSLFFALSLLFVPFGGVFAAPDLQNAAPVSGMVQSITLDADTVTGVTIVNLDLVNADEIVQSVRVSLETAIAQGFVVLNGDGKPIINNGALGKFVEIDPSSIIPTHEKNWHPVANALATYFSEIEGLDYETIMAAHNQGNGFGVIAQALWLTTKLAGNVEVFEALIDARESGDFSAFTLEDGSAPTNWGQLRNAILKKDKKNSVGVVISNSNGNGSENGNGNHSDKNNNKEKDKDKNNDKKK